MNPVWVELVPYISFVAAVAAFGVKIGRLLERQDRDTEDIKVLKQDAREIKEKVNNLDKHVAVQDSRLADIDRRITKG